MSGAGNEHVNPGVNPSHDDPGTVLLVTSNGPLRCWLRTLLQDQGLRCRVAASFIEAIAFVQRESFDLVLSDSRCSSRETSEFLESLALHAPSAVKYFLCEDSTVDDVVEAMRRGVSDCITLPVQEDELVDRVRQGVRNGQARRDRDDEYLSLKDSYEQMCQSHDVVSQKADTLSNDLVEVYQDMSEQLNEVAMSSEFQTLLRQELDIEELLRTSLEYMLTKTGPTNAAIFLSDSQNRFGLGAYVNYECARDQAQPLLQHFADNVCPRIADKTDIIRFDDARDFADSIGADASAIGQSDIVAFSCLNNGECMAVVLLFRNGNEKFDDRLPWTIDILRPILAGQLSRIINIHHRASAQWPEEAIDGVDDEDYGADDLAA